MNKITNERLNQLICIYGKLKDRYKSTDDLHVMLLLKELRDYRNQNSISNSGIKYEPDKEIDASEIDFSSKENMEFALKTLKNPDLLATYKFADFPDDWEFVEISDFYSSGATKLSPDNNEKIDSLWLSEYRLIGYAFETKDKVYDSIKISVAPIMFVDDNGCLSMFYQGRWKTPIQAKYVVFRKK